MLFNSEHEYRLNRNEWLYEEIHALTDEYSVIDAIEIALHDALQKEPNCPRVIEYYETLAGLTQEQLDKISINWDVNSICFEDCIAEYLND